MTRTRAFLSRLALRFPRTAQLVRRVRPGVRRVRRRYEGRSTAQVFTDVYHGRHWTCAESVSGGGSSRAAAEPLIRALPGALAELDVKVLLDAPCGDFNWMSQVDLSALDEYIGADIVEPLVEQLRREHGRDGRRFIHLDIIEDPLPDADAMLCRDCLIHLTHAQVGAVLENVRRSSIRWFMANTYPDVRLNADIITGEARPLHLCHAPFDLPAPHRIIEDPGGRPQPRRVLGVWSREQLG